MGLFSSILGAVAGPVLGLFGQKSSEKAAASANALSYEQNIGLMDHQNNINLQNTASDRAYAASTNSFAKLRTDAEAAGFNPLSALGLGGGALVNSGGGANTAGVGLNGAQVVLPAMSSAKFAAEALGDAVTTGFNAHKEYKEAEAEKIKIAKAKADLEAQKASNQQAGAKQSFGYSIPKVTEVPTDVIAVEPSMAETRPKARPNINTIPRTPVLLPDGTQRQIPRSLARRLDIQNFDYVGAEEYSEMVGQVRGDTENLLVTEKIGNAVGIPLFGTERYDPTKPRDKRGRKTTRKKPTEKRTAAKPTSKRGRNKAR